MDGLSNRSFARPSTGASSSACLRVPESCGATRRSVSRGRIPRLSQATKQELLRLSNPNTLSGVADFDSRITSLDAVFAANGDPRGVFTSLYRVITSKAAASVRASRYQDNEWADKLVVDFGERYLKNLHAHLKGGRVDAGWKRYYDLANNPNVDLKRLALMGAAIHLVVDLPASLAALDTPRERRDDFMLFGNILLEDYRAMIDAAQASHGIDMSDALASLIVSLPCVWSKRRSTSVHGAWLPVMTFWPTRRPRRSSSWAVRRGRRMQPT